MCGLCGCHGLVWILLTILNTLCKKAPIHQVTTMLATSRNVAFPGHNHLLTTSTDDPAQVKCSAISTGGYDLETGHFLKWLAWWLPGG